MPRKISDDRTYRRGKKKEDQRGTTRRNCNDSETKRETGGERGQKETRTSLSGRLYVEVGRERASRRRLVERGCLSLIKISRNSSARPRKFAAAIHSLASFASTCVSLFLSFPPPSRSSLRRFAGVEFLIFNYLPVLLISCAWPLGRDCRAEW